MGFSLKCPECRGKFPWQPKLRYPKICPLCEADIGCDRDDDDIVMPSIRTMRSVTADKVYRDIEKGSEVRAELAAQAVGCDPSEMSGLKITNMNDRNDCEIGHVELPANNEVAAAMAKMPSMGFGNAGLAYSGAVGQGEHANAGARTQAMIRQQHNPALVHDFPANELSAPGYRKRV